MLFRSGLTAKQGGDDAWFVIQNMPMPGVDERKEAILPHLVNGPAAYWQDLRSKLFGIDEFANSFVRDFRLGGFLGHSYVPAFAVESKKKNKEFFLVHFIFDRHRSIYLYLLLIFT